MTIFEAVKTTVAPRMAAEHFGLSVSRNGMVCCPFHDDRHPSMKLYEDHYHCFGCQANGDVIAFTPKLFSITPLEAAQKLAIDFGIREDRPSVLAKLKMYTTQAENEKLCFRVLSEFYRRQLILSVKKKPPNREDDPFLADKLCGEIEGIFLWCLEGLRRLQSSNFRFTESSQTKANREDARREADNVLLFLRSEGYICLKADSAIPSAALYGIYCLWCSDNAYKPLAARTVSMTLKKHADEFGLEHDNHIQNARGKRVNGFWGIEALVAPPVL